MSLSLQQILVARPITRIFSCTTRGAPHGRYCMSPSRACVLFQERTLKEPATAISSISLFTLPFLPVLSFPRRTQVTMSAFAFELAAQFGGRVPTTLVGVASLTSLLQADREPVAQDIEGYQAFRARACRSAGSLRHLKAGSYATVSADDGSTETYLKGEDASDNDVNPADGSALRPWKRGRSTSDPTDLVHRRRPEVSLSTSKQLVIKIGGPIDLFELWGQLEIFEWLRPNWAKIWDSFDFTEDPMIHPEVSFAQQ